MLVSGLVGEVGAWVGDAMSEYMFTFYVYRIMSLYRRVSRMRASENATDV